MPRPPSPCPAPHLTPRLSPVDPTAAARPAEDRPLLPPCVGRPAPAQLLRTHTGCTCPGPPANQHRVPRIPAMPCFPSRSTPGALSSAEASSHPPLLLILCVFLPHLYPSLLWGVPRLLMPPAPALTVPHQYPIALPLQAPICSPACLTLFLEHFLPMGMLCQPPTNPFICARVLSLCCLLFIPSNNIHPQSPFSCERPGHP